MATSEDQPIPDIEQATSIAGARILGVEAGTNDVKLFEVNDIKGDFKGGVSTGSENPGTPVLAQYYRAKPGITYTNFKDATNTAISIPTKVGAQYVSNAQLIFDGTNWYAFWDLQDSPDLTDYTSKAFLLTPLTNIITSLSTGIWKSSDQSIDATQAAYKATNIFVTTPSANFVFKGLNASLGNSSIGRCYTAAGGFVATLTVGMLSDITGGKKLTLPSTSTIARVGFHFTGSEADSIVMMNGTTLPVDKINPNLLPIPVTDNAQIANGAGYAKSNDVVAQSDIYGVQNLITSIISGLYGSSGSAPVTPNATYNCTNLMPAVPGQKFAIKGLNLSLSNASIAKYYTAAGVYVSQVTPANLSDITGGKTFTVPNTGTIAQIGFNFTKADAPEQSSGAITSIIVQNGNILNLGIILKSKLPLSSIKLSELQNDLNSSSDSTALKMYDAGFEDDNSVLATPAVGLTSNGQSNDDGRADTVELPSYFTSNGNKITDVLLCVNDSGTYREFSDLDFSMATGVPTWSFELPLYYKLITYIKSVSGHSADKLYVIKYALGSTSISPNISTAPGYWTPEFEKIPSGKQVLIKKAKSRFRKAKGTATGGLFNINAQIWHQGETDRDDAANYYQNMKNVIYYIRGYVKNMNLPFIIGGINTASTGYSSVVEAAKVQLASELPYVYYAPVTNGTSYLRSDDVLHFNGAGCEDMATSMFNIMMANKAVFGLPV